MFSLLQKRFILNSSLLPHVKFIIFSIVYAIVWLFLGWTVDTEVTWSRTPVQTLNYLNFICLVLIKILTETNFEQVFTI